MKTITTLLFALIVSVAVGADVPTHLQEISVTISAGGATGSGVIFTRNAQTGDAINFIWTAAHVVDGLRTEREVITPDGSKKTVVEFNDAKIVKELHENARTVGRLELDAEILKYSNADTGEDLALLRLRKPNFIQSTAEFYLDKEVPPIGTELFHVGSLLGQMGANSMTTGIISQQGRVVTKQVYDQTTVAAFPGCITGDTIVDLGAGESKPIIEILGGDAVISYDSRIVMANGVWGDTIAPGGKVLSFQTVTGQSKRGVGGENLRPVVRGHVRKVWATGERPVLKIATRNRAIRVTENHPFVRAVAVPAINGKVYHVAQWCRADELAPGDVVAVMSGHTEYRKSQSLNLAHEFGVADNHAPMMRLMGFYVGDGHSRIRDGQGGEVCLYTFDDDDAARYGGIVSKCVGASPKLATTPSGQYLRVSSVGLAAQIARLGFTGDAKTKRVPSWVYQCPPLLQREFIEGYVDADGHRRRGGYSIEAANNGLVWDLYALANNLSMGTSNIVERHRVANFSGREVQSRTWAADIYPDPVKKGAQFSGTTELLPVGLKWERIALVEAAGVEMTYDMEIDTYHNFFANGFLVHNSSGGGVFLKDGRYVGMLVRGAGETFNLIVPVRRIADFAKRVNIEWAIDPSKALPPEDELRAIPIEDMKANLQSAKK